MALDLNYFYGNEAEQFSFYRIPKTLFADAAYKSVPVEAKVLYGLLLDRMGLSSRNGWLDENNRVYIYFTVEDAVAQMGCGKDKVVKLFKVLDSDTGIGLIERRKQGQGRPARIYVKNFILPSNSETEPALEPSVPEDRLPESKPESSASEPHNSGKNFMSKEAPTYESEVQTSENQKSESGKIVEKAAYSHKSEVQTSEKPKSRERKSRSQDFGKTDPNKTNKNNTERNDTEIPSIHPAPSAARRSRTPKVDTDKMDLYRDLIKQNIGYNDILRENPEDDELLDGYVDLMVEVCCTRRASIRINGENLPSEVVKSRFLKLNRDHIAYVMESMTKTTTKIGNIRAYMLTALYNAPSTMSQYYFAEAGYDMAAGFS